MRDRSHLEGLTKGQRRRLMRYVCGWCEQRLDVDECGAMYGNEHCTKETRATRRAKCLAEYKPRKP